MARRVYKKKARPIFPLGVPQPYAALAKAAWDNDATQRPPFTVVLQRLGEMLTAFTSANSSGSHGAGGGSGSSAMAAGGGAPQQPGLAAAVPRG